MPQGLGRRRLGFRIEGFGFIVSVQGWGHRVEICEYRISGFVCRIHGAGEQGAGVVGHALVPPQFRLPHITHTNKTKTPKTNLFPLPPAPPTPVPAHARAHTLVTAFTSAPLASSACTTCKEPISESAA